MYQVQVIAGGPISGPFLREEYSPGQTYSFPAEDKEYVEAAFSSGRFSVTEVEEPKAAKADEKPAKSAKADK